MYIIYVIITYFYTLLRFRVDLEYIYKKKIRVRKFSNLIIPKLSD